jgi:hypothetical protein
MVRRYGILYKVDRLCGFWGRARDDLNYRLSLYYENQVGNGSGGVVRAIVS